MHVQIMKQAVYIFDGKDVDIGTIESTVLALEGVRHVDFVARRADKIIVVVSQNDISETHNEGADGLLELLSDRAQAIHAEKLKLIDRHTLSENRKGGT